MSSQTCRAACKGQGFALSGTYNGDREWSLYTINVKGRQTHPYRTQNASVVTIGLAEECYLRSCARPSVQVSHILRVVQHKSLEPDLCGIKLGNQTEFCGSSVAMDVSTTSGWKAAEATGAEAGFQGCFSDPLTLQQFYFVTTLNSPDLCSETCSMKGYSLAGVSQGSKFFPLALKPQLNDAGTPPGQISVFAVTLYRRTTCLPAHVIWRVLVSEMLRVCFSVNLTDYVLFQAFRTGNVVLQAPLQCIKQRLRSHTSSLSTSYGTVQLGRSVT